MQNKRNTLHLVLAFLIMLVTFPVTAHAGLLTDISTLLSTYVSPQDESVAMLRNVFGDFALDPFNSGGAATTGGGSIIGSMFLEYNWFIFVVAMLWFSYNAAASLAQTMHEGVVFGQRMSTVWMPIRIAFGSVSLMPVFGGWAFCQALMMIASLLGIAGANSISQVAISSAGGFQTVVNPMGGVRQAAALHNIEINMIKMTACQQAAGMMAQESAAYNVVMSGNSNTVFTAQPVPGTTDIVMKFPSKNGPAACGTIKLNFSPRTDTTISSAFGFRVAGINYEGIRARSMVAHVNTLRTLYTQAQAIVVNSVNTPSAVPQNAMSIIGGGYFNNYNTIFQLQLAALTSDTNAAANTSAIQDSLMAKMREGGWATLGIWYGVFAEVNEAMNEMLDPVVSFVNPEIATSIEKDTLSKVTSMINSVLDYPQNTWGGAAVSATGNASLGQWIMGGAMQAIVGSGGTGANNNINPIIVMKNIGDNTIVLAETIYVVSKFMGTGDSKKDDDSVASKLAGGAEKVASLTGLGRILTTLKAIFMDMSALAFPLALGLFAVGATMAFYLPMLPFIQWFASLMHWFISVVESFLGASLWALAHFDSDGEGMGQRASYGYQYMLNNFARPIIMTFAFFIASAAIMVMGTYLFRYFGNSVASAQGNTLTGLISIFAYLVIMGVMGIALVNNCFGILLKLADTIIGFIGSSAGSAFQNDTENRINVMFVSALRSAGQLRGRGMSGGVNQNTNGKPIGGGQNGGQSGMPTRAP